MIFDAKRVAKALRQVSGRIHLRAVDAAVGDIGRWWTLDDVAGQGCLRLVDANASDEPGDDARRVLVGIPSPGCGLSVEAEIRDDALIWARDARVTPISSRGRPRAWIARSPDDEPSSEAELEAMIAPGEDVPPWWGEVHARDVSWYGLSLWLAADGQVDPPDPRRTEVADFRLVLRRPMTGASLTVTVSVERVESWTRRDRNGRAWRALGFSIQRPDLHAATGPGPEWHEWWRWVADRLYPETIQHRVGPLAWEILRNWFFRLAGPGRESFEHIRADWLRTVAGFDRSSLLGHVIVYPMPVGASSPRSAALHGDGDRSRRGTGCTRSPRLDFRVVDQRLPIARRIFLRDDISELYDSGLVTIAFQHLYARTWMGHQLGLNPLALALDSTAAAHIKVEIYRHAFGLIGRDHSAEWVAGSCRLIRWMHRHFDPAIFAEAEAENRACCIPLRPVEIRASTPTFSPQRLTRVTVRPAHRGGDIDRLLARIAKVRPRPYCEALDLTPDRFDLAEANAWFDRHGPGTGAYVERSVLIAELEDRPIAAAVVETTHRGASVFRLFDSVRIFDLVDELHTAIGDAARQALLDRAKTHFDAFRRDFFIYYLEHHADPELPGYLDLFDFEDAEEGFFWVMHASDVPRFLDWVWVESTA